MEKIISTIIVKRIDTDKAYNYVARQYYLDDKGNGHVRRLQFYDVPQKYLYGQQVEIGKRVSPQGIVGKAEIIKAKDEGQRKRIFNLKEMMDNFLMVSDGDYYNEVLKEDGIIDNNNELIDVDKDLEFELQERARYHTKVYGYAMDRVALENNDNETVGDDIAAIRDKMADCYIKMNLVIDESLIDEDDISQMNDKLKKFSRPLYQNACEILDLINERNQTNERTL